MSLKSKAGKATLGVLLAAQLFTSSAVAAPNRVVQEFKKAPEARMELGQFKGEIKIFLYKNGKRTRVDQNMKDGLRVIAGRTCLGIRDLTNAIEGAQVEWDGQNRIVDINHNGKQISYPIDKKLMWDGEGTKPIDVSATIDPKEGRTYLPIRSIGETLGYTVVWDDASREVTLVTPGETYKAPITSQKPAAKPAGKGNRMTTAKGRKLLSLEELVQMAEKYRKETGMAGRGFYTFLSPEDSVDNGDGTMTVLGGTPYATILHSPFKKVDSSPARPGFKILAHNPNDPRVGTYVYGKGNKHYEHTITNNAAIFEYEDWETGETATEGRIMVQQMAYSPGFLEEFNSETMSSRKISEAEEKNFWKNAKWATKDAEKFARDGNWKFYDMTGMFDVGQRISSIFGNGLLPDVIFDSMAITTDGYVGWNTSPIMAGKTMDKVIIRTYLKGVQGHVAMVVQVPQMKIEPSTSREGYYGNVSPKYIELAQYKEDE